MPNDTTPFAPTSVEGTRIVLLAIARTLLQEVQDAVLESFVHAFESDEAGARSLNDFAQYVAYAYQRNMGDLKTKLTSVAFAPYMDNCEMANQILASLQANPSWLHEEIAANVKPKRKVFVSHSSKDKRYVTPFIDLLRKMGFDETNLFCSSYPGFGIRKFGSSITEELRMNYRDYELFVVYLISKENYYESEFCLNEMGAAWVLMTDNAPILLPGTHSSDMRGVVTSNDMAIEIDSDDSQTSLIELMVALREFMGIETPIDPLAFARDVSAFVDSCLS